MDTLLMNSENSKTSDSHRLLLKGINILLYQITAVTIRGKNIKSHTKLINLQYQLQQGMKSLNYLMDHSLCQIFKLTSNISF